MLDAPVSGGQPKAIDGSLSIMVGGAQADFFRKIWKYSVMLLLAVIVLIVLQAYVVPGIVPVDVSGVAP